MSRIAWTYIIGVIALGIGIGLLGLDMLPTTGFEWLTFITLTMAAILTQFFEVADSRQSYYLHTVFFFAGVILLPPPLFVCLIILPHAVEWLQKRLASSHFLRDWYLSTF